MSSPAAEIEVDEALVRGLLADQQPDLAGLDLVEVGTGWDNVLWRLGDTLAVRLPRRALAAPLLLHEQQWLPELAPHLPLPVPAPVRLGRPSAGYPWSWSVVPWLGGGPGDREAITETEDAARRVGEFLRALHHPAPPSAPDNPYRGVRLIDRASAFEERIGQLASEVDVAAVRRVWEDAVAAPAHPGPKVWIHGDLHPANVLILDGTVSAVIDFGDMCAGDPATDVAAAWMLLPTSAQTTFRKAYGGVQPDLERRSRGWALLFALMLLAVGLDDRPSYEEVARSTLRRTLSRPVP